jgi:hypothetical protein
MARGRTGRFPFVVLNITNQLLVNLGGFAHSVLNRMV